MHKQDDDTIWSSLRRQSSTCGFRHAVFGHCGHSHRSGTHLASRVHPLWAQSSLCVEDKLSVGHGQSGWGSHMQVRACIASCTRIIRSLQVVMVCSTIQMRLICSSYPYRAFPPRLARSSPSNYSSSFPFVPLVRTARGTTPLAFFLSVSGGTCDFSGIWTLKPGTLMPYDVSARLSAALVRYVEASEEADLSNKPDP